MYFNKNVSFEKLKELGFKEHINVYYFTTTNDDDSQYLGEIFVDKKTREISFYVTNDHLMGDLKTFTHRDEECCSVENVDEVLFVDTLFNLDTLMIMFEKGMITND